MNNTHNMHNNRNKYDTRNWCGANNLYNMRYTHNTPNTLNVIHKNGYPQGRNDQLAMILSTLGKPTV